MNSVIIDNVLIIADIFISCKNNTNILIIIFGNQDYIFKNSSVNIFKSKIIIDNSEYNVNFLKSSNYKHLDHGGTIINNNCIKNIEIGYINDYNIDNKNIIIKFDNGLQYNIILNDIINLSNQNCLTTIHKNEHHLIPSWINYHKKLGFENFVIYDNDYDSDKNSQLLKDFENDIIIIDASIFPYKLNNKIIAQIIQQNHCLWKYNFNFIGFTDLDEYINIDKKYLFNDEYPIISLPNYWFGCNNKIEYNNDNFTEKLIKREKSGNIFEQRKCIVKSNNVDIMNVHIPLKFTGKKTYLNYNEGYLKHYKILSSKNRKCACHFYDSVIDTSNEKYLDRNIIIYILSWKRVSENSRNIYDEISKVHDKVYILNCNENFKMERNNAIEANDSYYFTQQIFTCLNHCKTNFPGSYIMTITGDISPIANWSDIIERTLFAFRFLKAGIVAPNVDFTSWTNRYSEIKDNFWSVENTDCTVWSLHPEVYEFLLSSEIDNISKFGWGIDWVLIQFCKKYELNILRDYNNLIIHPKETGYNGEIANKEFSLVKELWYKISRINPIFFLSQNPSIQLLDYVKKLNTKFNVYIVVHDNNYIPKYEHEHLILKVDNKECINSGFIQSDFSTSKRKDICSVWDKINYILCKNIINVNFAWIIEENVLIQDSSIFDKYSEYDLISPYNEVNLNGKRNYWKWGLIPKNAPKPWYCSMVPIIGISDKMIEKIKLFVEKNKTLLLNEFMYNTFCSIYNLKKYSPPELQYVKWNENWSEELIESKTNNIFFPYNKRMLFRKNKIHFVSFASNNIIKSLNRIKNEAINSNFFDYIHCLTEGDIQEYLNKHLEFIQNNKRGFGYWIWKPYIIYKVFNLMNEGDFLLFLDAGFTINPKGRERFYEYLTMCKNSQYSNISSQYKQYIESHYTKNDIFEYFNTTENDKKSGQIKSGFWLLQKNDFTNKLVNEYLKHIQNYYLIDDSLSITSNDNNFIENRHDQSIFSCILKKEGTTCIENEMDLDGGGVEKYKNSLHIPFWATRLR